MLAGEIREYPTPAPGPGFNNLARLALVAVYVLVAAMSSFTKAFSPAIREIRILCCQTGAASAETR